MYEKSKPQVLHLCIPSMIKAFDMVHSNFDLTSRILVFSLVFKH